MGLKWKFQRGGGGGLNQKTFHGRGMDILWNNTIKYDCKVWSADFSLYTYIRKAVTSSLPIKCGCTKL